MQKMVPQKNFVKEGYMKPGVRRRKEKKENIKNSRRNQRNEYRRAA